MEQPQDGYTIKAYSKLIGKHPNTVRLQVRVGDIPAKMTKGRSGYEWRLFPDGLPGDPVSMLCDNGTPDNKVTSAHLPPDLVSVIRKSVENETLILKEENRKLWDLVNKTRRNGEHWHPWRETVKLIGDAVLRLTRRLLAVRS